MTLSKDDADLFYELWFSLLNFANQKFNIVPEIEEFSRKKSCDINLVKKVADAIWNDVQLIDEYLIHQGGKISEEDRQIIRGWKRFVADDFILERNLKSGSVFISMHTANVYLVKGIISSWEEMFYFCSPPIALKAVLIPFKNVIISDGLVSAYNVAFGRNYTSSWKEIYLTAKKSGAVHRIL